MRLLQADLDRLSQIITSIYATMHVGGLNAVLLEKLPSLIASDSHSIALVPLNGQALIHHNAPHLRQIAAERLWALRKFLRQHPLESAGEVSAKWGARCMSDFLTRRQFHRTDLYNEFYRHVEAEYQLSIYTERMAGFRIRVSASSKHKDFAARERAILNALSPHICQAYKNSFAIANLREAASELEAAAEAHGQGFIRIDQSGTIQHMTILAGDLLQKYFNHSPQTRKTLPTELQRWLKAGSPEEIVAHKRAPLVIAKPCGRLVVRTAAEGDERVLLLAEQPPAKSPGDLAVLGLRPRESEILFWMCQGKSNPELAAILGVSVRTIHKHNENIFRKLGVENRHAATLMAAPFLRHT